MGHEGSSNRKSTQLPVVVRQFPPPLCRLSLVSQSAETLPKSLLRSFDLNSKYEAFHSRGNNKKKQHVPRKWHPYNSDKHHKYVDLSLIAQTASSPQRSHARGEHSATLTKALRFQTCCTQTSAAGVEGQLPKGLAFLFGTVVAEIVAVGPRTSSAAEEHRTRVVLAHSLGTDAAVVGIAAGTAVGEQTAGELYPTQPSLQCFAAALGAPTNSDSALRAQRFGGSLS